ncbi:MAG: hypothetical protein OXG49_16120, partial [Chloroflexi bacterium]|nr:hypothetical protein [Chloroflexota bacterium]
MATDDTGLTTEIAATATPTVTATEAEPPTIEILPSATPLPRETVATVGPDIAPANLTLTASRAAIDERRELTAAGPSPTASPTDTAATAPPSATATESESPPIEVLASATPIATEVPGTATPEIAPANLTLTAIRASIDERRELTAVRPSPTASPTDIAATATLSTAATKTESRTIVVVASETPLPTKVSATAGPDIAPATLTLTAIRA